MDERSASYAIMSPLLVISGYAFVRRKKFAVLMTYVWISFSVVVFLFYLLDALTNKRVTPEQQVEEIGQGLGYMVIGCLYWGLCAVYYRKRRPEFR